MELSLKRTNELRSIIKLYCFDYKQLLYQQNPTLEDELNARFSSYKSLLKIYPYEAISKLISDMNNEISLLGSSSSFSRESIRTELIRSFNLIIIHNKNRPKVIADDLDDVRSFTILQAYSIIDKAYMAIKERVSILSPVINQPPKADTGLELYLNDNGKKIYPRLKSHYSGCEPRFIGAMLYALQSLEMLNIAVYKIPNGDLAKALSVSFNKNLTHQYVDSSENGFKGKFETPRHKYKLDLEKEIQKIKSFI